VAPQPVSNPTRRFVLTRTVGGVETNVVVGALLPSGFGSADDRVARATALAAARSNRDGNPDVIFRLYGPSNSGNHTDGDCVWDSRVKQ
jgi:hypothetical protein